MEAEDIQKTIKEILEKLQESTPIFMDDLKAALLKAKALGSISEMECILEEKRLKHPDIDYSEQNNRINTFHELLSNFMMVHSDWQRNQNEIWKLQRTVFVLYDTMMEYKKENAILKQSIETYITNEKAA